MKKKRATFSQWDHLNPQIIFDRGSPLLRVFVFAFFLIVAGIIFSLLDVLAWIGGFIFCIGLISLALWLYLELA